jgi:chromosome segregation ATPase
MEQADIDRIALLGHNRELTRLVKEASREREVQREQVEELKRQLEESEADRRARLDQVYELTRLLRESEADGQARLDQIHELTRMLRESEADRQARLDEIYQLTRLVHEAQARLEEASEQRRLAEALQRELAAIKQTRFWRARCWLRSILFAEAHRS